MPFLADFFNLIFLPIVITSPQINLYFTDSVNNPSTDVLFEHTCLYVTAVLDKKTNTQQLLSFCLSEFSTQWKLQKNDSNQVLTFAELHQKGITSEQLYIWSAPIDIIERYQFYLTQFEPSMSNELFSNCTLPKFGPSCEYEFDDYKSEYSSLIEMINDFYLKHPYKPTTLTCYLDLKCNRGPFPSCLDWSEICDGKVDCLDDGIDEEHCWKLEINQCEENEYRCSNGQCIPYDFFRDNPFLPDCLDGSDEIENEIEFPYNCTIKIPSFACEDVTCTLHRSAKLFQYKTLLTSSCEPSRNIRLSEILFSNQSKFVSDDCWTAFKCIVHMPVSQEPQCRQLCQNKACDNMIKDKCPEILFIPEVPVLFDRIYFAYAKSYSKYSDRIEPFPYYICFKDQFCDELVNNRQFIVFNNTKCVRPGEIPVIFSTMKQGLLWASKYIFPTSNIFLS